MTSESHQEFADRFLAMIYGSIENALRKQSGGSMFETYKLNEKGFDEVRLFKALMADAVEVALNKMPEGKAKACFTTKIEEALFWGTRSLSSKPENHSEIIVHRPGNI